MCNILELIIQTDTDEDYEEGSGDDVDDSDGHENDDDTNAMIARASIEDDLRTLVSYTSLINQESRRENESKVYEFNPTSPPDDDDEALAISLIPQYSDYVQSSLRRIFGPRNWQLFQQERPLFANRLVSTIILRWRRLSYRMSRAAAPPTLPRPERMAEPSGAPLTTHTFSAQKISRVPKFPEQAEEKRIGPEMRSEGSTLQPGATINQREIPQKSVRTATVAATTDLAYPPPPKMERLNAMEVQFHCDFCDNLRIEKVKAGMETSAWQ